MTKAKEKFEIVKDSKVTNVEGIQKKKPSKRIRSSNIGITINTNQRIGQYDKRLRSYCEKVKRAVDEIADEMETGKHILIKEDGKEFSPDLIKKLLFWNRVERAPTNDTIHTHCLFGFSHYTKLHLDVKSIKEAICQKLELKNVYIKRPYVLRGSFQNDVERYKQYIDKNVDDVEEEEQQNNNSEDNDE